MREFLFDFYGTLADIRTDETGGEFWEEMSRFTGGRQSAETLRKRYLALCAQAQAALPPLGEPDLIPVFRALLEPLSASCGAEEFARFFRARSLKKLRLFEGAEELLQGLRRRGARIWLVSNAQACFTRSELSALGIESRFDGILLSSEAGWKKPSPRIFGIAFGRFGISPDRCIYIGNDLRDDVGGAHAVGMPCVYLQTEQSGEYPDPPAPDFAPKNFSALTELLFRFAEEG